MGLNSYLRSFSWALLFFIISAASAWEITTESSDGFTVMLPDLTVEMKTVGDKVYFEKTDFAGLPGQPGVPAKAISILLPPNVDPNNVTVSLVDVKYETITGAWDVAPAPPYMINENQAIWPQNLTIVDGRDIFTYGNNAFFPATSLGKMSIGRMRQWQIASVQLFPYQYNPVSKELRRLIDGKLKVAFKRSVIARMSSSRDRVGEALAEEVRKRVINFAELAPEYLGNYKMSNVTSEQGRYVIVTTQNILANSRQLSAFVQAKQQRGFTVDVVTETTWGGGIGDMAAERLRSWLANNYEALQIRYVLLVGNTDPQYGDVPMKMCYPRNNETYYPNYREAPTDLYYAELTGNWDLDGDGMYGEYPDDVGVGGADCNYEVIVGRIPFYGSYEDLDHILAKTIRYDNATIYWRRNVLMAMEPSDEITPGYHLGEEIKSKVLLPAGYSYHRVYEENYGIFPPPETTPCTVDSVSRAWNAADYGAVFWWTHGSTQSATDVMNTYYAKTLKDDRPVFTFQCSCNNAYPEYPENLAYSLLKNGAVSTVAATRVSWYQPGPQLFEGSSSNAGLTFRYARGIITDALPAGDAFYQALSGTAIWGNAWWMNCLVFNIYGDPSVGLTIGGKDEIPPTKPAALTVVANEGTRVTLTWSASSDNERVAGYEVFRDGFKIATLPQTVFSDTSVSPGKYYTYKIYAFDDAGNCSEPSDELTVLTESGNMVTVYYKRGFATPYIHYKKADGAWTQIPGEPMQVSTFTDYSVATIFIGSQARLEACFNDGKGNWDSRNGANYFFDANGTYTVEYGQVKLGPPAGDTTPPTPPQNLSLVTKTATSISLSWLPATDNTGVKGYAVYRDGNEMARTAELSYVDQNLSPNTTYRYVVKAYDQAGNMSHPSNELVVTTDGGPANTVTIYYKRGFATPYIHYKKANGTWTQIPGVRMEDSSFAGYSVATIDLGSQARLEACFNDGKGNWDSRNGANYFFEPGVWTFNAGQILKGAPGQQ